MESKEKEIEEMMLAVPQKIVAFDMNPKGQHLYGEQRKEIAEALYNAGYRKTFASDTQKAYKDGYEKGIKDEEEKINRLLDTLYDSWDENSRLKNEIIKKDEILQKNIDTAIDTHKRYICNVDEQRKQAVKEFAINLKKVIHERDYLQGYAEIGLIEEIDELLKEYEI